MNLEPRNESDYDDRQIKAARRVLVDVGQVLASFADCIVVVGGWTPDLLIKESNEPHIGSIDVDLALDAEKLNDGRYADLIKLLLDTRRYRRGEKEFQFVVDVDLGDRGRPVQVAVEFLAPGEVKLKKNRPKLVNNFRVLQVEACNEAFHAPVDVEISGSNVSGADNTVHLRVVALMDFIIMKALAIGGRDKPKDAYDLCYCLEHASEKMQGVADAWKSRSDDPNVGKAILILREKFSKVVSFGPQQVVEFYNDADTEARAMHARRAFELVQDFLGKL